MEFFKTFSFCSCSLLFIVLATHAAPYTGSGEGEVTNSCLQPKTKLLNCDYENERETQFYFDQRQNRCRGYHTCPISSTNHTVIPNLFQTRAECTASCPATTCLVNEQPPSNGQHVVVKHDNGVVNLMYSCSEGFKLLGEAERTCQYDGTWSGEQPSCSEIRCPKPLDINNGTKIVRLLHPASTHDAPKPNDYMIYSCDKGFHNIQNTRMFWMCQKDGTWSSNVLPVCGMLEIRYNNTVVDGDMTAKDGEVLQVDCVMTPSFPKNADVTWQYPTPNGINITHTAGDKLNDQSAYSLKIGGVEPANSGDYICTASIGNVVFKKVIKVKVQRVIVNLTVIMQPQLFKDDNAIDLTCAFHGSVKPNVVWLYNDAVLDTARNSRITVTELTERNSHYTFSRLRIVNPRQEDSGTYVCQGSNLDGTVNSLPLNVQITEGTTQRARRSLSPSSSSSTLQFSSLCGSSDPATGIYLGKMVRKHPKSKAYYLSLDKVIHSSSPAESRHYMLTRSAAHTELSLNRNTRYLFSVRTTDRGEHILTAAYPHNQDLERVLSTVCPQLHH